MAFPVELFNKYLPGYTCHRPELFDGSEWLSPHMFGWPAHRPRSYTVLTKDSRVSLNGFNDVMNLLYCKVNMGVENLFSAPQERGFKCSLAYIL